MKKILFVDDDETFQLIMKHVATRSGVRVDQCLDPLSAITMLELNGYDAIFIDQRLPDIEGTELIKILSNKYPAKKFYLVTNFPQDSIKEDLKKINVSGFIDKNYLSERMLEVFNE